MMLRQQQSCKILGGCCETGWGLKRLEQVCTIKDGGSPRPIKKLTNDDDGVNWIKIGDTELGDDIYTLQKKRLNPMGSHAQDMSEVVLFIVRTQ